MTSDAGKGIPAAGRMFFAIGLAGFGVLQFIYGDFVPGRAPPWPEGIPARWIWVGVSGTILIAAGAAIISGWKAREASIVVGTLILFWALLRHLPLVAANPHGAVLTQAGKALALCGGAFAVAGFTILGRLGLGSFMILAGIQHFLFAGFVATLVPAWIPGSSFWTYFAGIALIAGGAGLLLRRTLRPAAALSGLMIFLWVLLLHLPRALGAAPAAQRNEWTALFEALAFSGIALVLAEPVRSQPSRSEHAANAN